MFESSLILEGYVKQVDCEFSALESGKAAISVKVVIESESAPSESTLDYMMVRVGGDIKAAGGSMFEEDTVVVSSVFTASVELDTSADSPCPSKECWIHDPLENKCHLRTLQACSTLQCTDSEMRLTFKKELFGVDGSMNAPFGPVDECTPVWRDDHWEWNQPIGNCQMTAESIMEYDSIEYVIYS